VILLLLYQWMGFPNYILLWFHPSLVSSVLTWARRYINIVIVIFGFSPFLLNFWKVRVPWHTVCVFFMCILTWDFSFKYLSWDGRREGGGGGGLLVFLVSTISVTRKKLRILSFHIRLSLDSSHPCEKFHLFCSTREPKRSPPSPPLPSLLTPKLHFGFGFGLWDEPPSDTKQLMSFGYNSRTTKKTTIQFFCPLQST